MRFLRFYLKQTIIQFWKILIFIIVLLNRKNKKTNNKLRIFFGGAIKGNIGGPLVKIKNLKKFFPEYRKKFNILYLISNNSYITNNSLKILKRRGIPIVLNQNGVYYPAWFKGDYIKKNIELAKAYHHADYVFWQSKFCKKASNKFLGERQGNGEVLYNCVDTEIFVPKNNSKKKFTFLITGNINSSNNYRFLAVLKALKKLKKLDKNIRLIIAGNIEDQNFLRLNLMKMKINNSVNFIGKYNQLDAPNIYQLADAYITMTYQDNCPSAVLEAMSCGLPILYSASGGLPELVDKDCGIGLDVEENWKQIKVPRTRSIMEGMEKIIERRKIMSNFARERVLKNFNQNQWILRHKIIFEKYLK